MESEKRADAPAAPGVREDLVKTAVQFLQNVRVRDSSTAHKEAFLRKKGLNDDEIKLAFQRAGPSLELQKFDQSPQQLQQAYMPPPPQLVVVQPSYWSHWQNVVKTAILVTGVSYGIYYLFDRYFGPLLWGSRDRLRSVEESLSSLDRSLVSTCRELQESLRQVTETLALQQVELSRLTESRAEVLSSSSHITKLEAEISSVKSLLLSRRQFPTVPSTSPGIPSWQLSQEGEESMAAKDSSTESGDPSPVSNGTSSPELVERLDERCGSSE